MSKIEAKCFEVEEVIDRIFTSLTTQMISLQMERCQTSHLISGPKKCFEIHTEGIFASIFLFEIDEAVYDKIACTMVKSNRMSDSEKVVYVTEYLNIICGRILSAINNIVGEQSRLSIPILMETKTIVDMKVKNCYKSPIGSVNIGVDYEMKKA